MTYDFFIASRWRNKEQVLELTQKLRAKGKKVYCFVEGEGLSSDLKELEQSLDPHAFMEHFESLSDWKKSDAIREIFEVDMRALRESEALILLLPAGKSSHVEAGAAYGMGKRCILVGEQKETESLYLIFTEHYATIDECVEAVS